MNKKTLGGLCAIYCILSVIAYFIWGAIGGSYNNAWIVFLIAGAACAITSIIAGIKNDKTDKSE